MLANRGRIIAAAEGGDRDAFLGLYDQFGPMVYRFFFWLTGNENETRRLVIATFRRAFHAFRKRPRDMVLDTWFYRMAARTFLAATRMDRLLRRAPRSVEVEDRSLEWRQATLALPPRLRVVWLLSLAEGMPQSQTAEVLGTSLDTVESLLERSRSSFPSPVPDAERVAVERAMRQFTAPRPSASLRMEVAAALGTGEATVRTRVMQAGIGLVVLALVGSVAFSLLRGEQEEAVAPEQAEAIPKTIIVLGEADTGALVSYDANSLKPTVVTGVGGSPIALALSADGRILYVLQEDGLLTVDAQSRVVGRLLQLPLQDWGSLAVAGQYVVVGSQTVNSLVAMGENDEEAAEIPLPWSVDVLVPLDDVRLLAVSVDRMQMVRVDVASRSVGEVITLGADLVFGAVVPDGESMSAFVTTPETEEIWRVDLATGQAVQFAVSPAGRATRGALNADGSALFLSMETDPLQVIEPDDNSESTAQARSRVPPVGTSRPTPPPDDESSDEEGTVAAPMPALTMFATADGSVERELWQSGGITQMALDPARNVLYALAPHANAILILDSRTLHVRNAVPLAVRPVAFALTAEDTE